MNLVERRRIFVWIDKSFEALHELIEVHKLGFLITAAENQQRLKLNENLRYNQCEQRAIMDRELQIQLSHEQLLFFFSSFLFMHVVNESEIGFFFIW